jgi:hypothetical protein
MQKRMLKAAFLTMAVIVILGMAGDGGSNRSEGISECPTWGRKIRH